MSTMLCPCETTTTLTLKLAAPPATPPPSAIDLSFLRSVSSSNISYSTKLSAKSLQLCTENLGSETGSEMMMMTDDDITTLFSSSRKKPNCRPVRKLSDRRSNSSFPPRLTTMNTLQVRRQCREGGRLIIEAVEMTNPVLQAERSNGRLRLCFLRTEEDEVESESESEIEECEEKKVEVEKFERVRRCSSNQQASWRKPASMWVAA